MPQALVPIDTPLSVIHKHIPRQSDIDKIVKIIETHVIHSLELPIQAQDLVKAYQHSTHPVSKHKIALEPKHLIMLLSTSCCSG